MDDGSPQAARTLIAGVEYRFVEKLASATVDGEVVVIPRGGGGPLVWGGAGWRTKAS